MRASHRDITSPAPTPRIARPCFPLYMLTLPDWWLGPNIFHLPSWLEMQGCEISYVKACAIIGNSNKAEGDRGTTITRARSSATEADPPSQTVPLTLSKVQSPIFNKSRKPIKSNRLAFQSASQDYARFR